MLLLSADISLTRLVGYVTRPVASHVTRSTPPRSVCATGWYPPRRVRLLRRREDVVVTATLIESPEHERVARGSMIMHVPLQDTEVAADKAVRRMTTTVVPMLDDKIGLVLNDAPQRVRLAN